MKNEHAGYGHCHIGEHDLPNVNSFRYLGTIVDNKGSLNLEFADRLKRASNGHVKSNLAIWKLINTHKDKIVYDPCMFYFNVWM